MTSPLIELEALPSAAAFYEHYWNKQPFVVRAGVSEAEMAELISGEELAGLALEENAQSRLVLAANAGAEAEPGSGSGSETGSGWGCRFGPFSEEDFQEIGAENWNLLVQNVEQFHPETARLLRPFSFAPRWLLDDVMVSYSAPGGTVGAHIDSYHVFLVQGSGRRRWKIGHAPILKEVFIEGIDLKVLAEDFEGDSVEVTCGDVLYVPPHFAHEGTTLEQALTYSIGFLGPKFSDLLAGYSQYLAAREEQDTRYVGAGLTPDSAGFHLNAGAVDVLRGQLTAQLNSADFTRWLVSYFTEPSHEDFGSWLEREEPLTLQEFQALLAEGAALIKPDYVKFAVTQEATDRFCLGVAGQSFSFDGNVHKVIAQLMTEAPVSLANAKALAETAKTTALLLALYNHEALEFAE